MPVAVRPRRESPGASLPHHSVVESENRGNDEKQGLPPNKCRSEQGSGNDGAGRGRESFCALGQEVIRRRRQACLPKVAPTPRVSIALLGEASSLVFDVLAGLPTGLFAAGVSATRAFGHFAGGTAGPAVPPPTVSRERRAVHRHRFQRGRVELPIRNVSTARAHCRPSRIAHTTSDCPRRMSPAAKTWLTLVW